MRYPIKRSEELQREGIEFRGYLPNLKAPTSIRAKQAYGACAASAVLKRTERYSNDSRVRSSGLRYSADLLAMGGRGKPFSPGKITFVFPTGTP